MVEQWRCWWGGIACAGVLVSLMSLAPSSHAADFACAAGEVACLIDAINQANANGEANTITLEAGTYTLTVVENTTDGPNGLPSVTSTLTIQGAGTDTTVIERDTSAPRFRLLHVAAAGALTLDGLTLRSGLALVPVAFGTFGGGLLNRGTLALVHTTLAANDSDDTGGLANCGGTVTIHHSTFANNSTFFGSGGLLNSGGTVLITSPTFANNNGPEGVGAILNDAGVVVVSDSTFTDKRGDIGAITNRAAGMLVVTNSTFTGNSADGARPLASGVFNAGTIVATNITLARHSSRVPGACGISRRGTTILQNTLLALNTRPVLGMGTEDCDCSGRVISLGNNLVGVTTNCTILLQPTDLTGDPGLGNFTDNSTPGNGHLPLQRGSPAIDAGNDATCPPTDQLGRRRVDMRKVGTSLCDIGAIEFRGRDDRQHDEEDDQHDEGQDQR